jgi:serine/threonine-protein kinase SRPK3
VKEEEREKADHRNGRRRRRTLITGSQPLPSPLNANFSPNDLSNFPGSTQSLNQVVNDSNKGTEPITGASPTGTDGAHMSGAVGSSGQTKSMLESLGIKPGEGGEVDPNQEREKTA